MRDLSTDQISVRFSIKWKLLVVMIVLTTVLVGLLTYFQISSQKNILENELKMRIVLMKDNLKERGKSHIKTLAQQVENDIAAYNFSGVMEALNASVKSNENIKYAILMNAAGKVFSHTLKPDLVDQELSTQRDRKALACKDLEVIDYDEHDESVIEIVTPIQISTNPWGVLRIIYTLKLLDQEIEHSKNKINKQAQNMIVNASKSALMFMMVCFIIVYFVVRRFTDPLLELANAARLIRDDMTGVEIPVLKGNDEVGELGRTFKEMVARIKTYVSNLEDLNARIQLKNKELERLDILKDEFLANTSHELRTPINGINGIVESLLDGVAGDLNYRQAENLQMVAASAKRLSSLVNDILDFSKLKGQDIHLTLKPLDLSMVVDQVQSISQHLIRAKGLLFINSIADSIPPVWGDASRVAQILHNLIGNAVKFTTQGQIEVSAKQEGTGVAVSVSDSGIGIPLDRQADIFKSFEQGDGSIEREYGGTGLGLTITKTLVELHNGHIRVTSEPGKGATFTFVLPISEKAAAVKSSKDAFPKKTASEEILSATEQIKTNPDEGPADITAHRTWLRDEPEMVSVKDIQDVVVLAVDDEPSNLQVIINNMKLAGVRVETALSGVEAQEKLVAVKPDIVLLDVMMPKMNGYETAKLIRNKFTKEELPIIFLTAKDQINDLVAGFSAGGNDYITKPLSRNELLIRMAYHIRLCKVHNELEARVKERTAELLEINKSLTQEIDQRIQVEKKLNESELKYRKLFESNAFIFFITDIEGTILMANNNAAKFYNKTRDSIVGNSLLDLRPDRAELYKSVVEQITTKNETIQFETLYPAPDEDKWLFVTVSPLKIKNDLRIQIITQDITKRKQAEQAKLELQERLGRAKKMEALGLLASGVAHDLNNILSGIVGYPQILLSDDTLNSKNKEYIKKIENTGKKAAAVVDDLLLISRGVVSQREPLNLNTLICEFLNSAEYLGNIGKNSAINIRTHLAPDLCNIKGSAIHLTKILLNLVVNASEAIEDSGNITISTENRFLDESINGHDEKLNGKYVALKVSDDGVGIPQENVHRIFEPFYTKKIMGKNGTGLGLALVWNAVQNHKGYIDVKSEKNRTTFELYFPVSQEKTIEKNEQPPLEQFMGNGETVLVVDDEEILREIACNMLSMLGYRAFAVSNGEDAIEYLKNHAIELVLLDMIMDPGMNGCETFEHIVKINPNQKAIIVSGYSETDDVKKTRKMGAGQFIRKPYTLETLGVAIKKELL